MGGLGSETLRVRMGGEAQFGGKTKPTIFFFHSISEPALLLLFFNKVQCGLELLSHYLHPCQLATSQGDFEF